MLVSEVEGLEQILAGFTSDLSTIDKILKAAKMGVEMEPVFQCGHSGLYFPRDYLNQWGRKYGIGLGPTPCSECLDTEYELDPPPITPQIRDISQIAHPVYVTKAQVDFDLVEVNHFRSNRLICAIDDPFMEKRAMLVRGKQLLNPRGKLHTMQAAWERSRKGL